MFLRSIGQKILKATALGMWRELGEGRTVDEVAVSGTVERKGWMDRMLHQTHWEHHEPHLDGLVNRTYTWLTHGLLNLYGGGFETSADHWWRKLES